MKKSISENIESKRKQNGLSVNALAQKAGIPDKTLRKLLDGTTEDPRYKTLLAVSNALDCTVSELIGEMSSEDTFFSMQRQRFYEQWEDLTPENREIVVNLIDSLSHLEERLKTKKEILVERQIPLYSLPVSAGFGSFLDSDSFEYVNFPAEELPDCKCFALRVSGDSMEPAYYAGDIIFVEPENHAQNGDIVVAIINGEGFVKQYRNGEFFSFNAAYSPICPGEYDQVQISGIVRGLKRL